jgi:hypothetical protein
MPEFLPEKKGERGISQSFPVLLKWHDLPSVMPAMFNRATIFSFHNLPHENPQK